MNVIEHYQILLDESAPLVKRHFPEIANLPVQLKSALQDNRLRIMLFGAYNAGKSTLINALTGQAVARVGDIPTTDAVHEYEWNSHLLLDTPGINAPIEHQEVSEKELERADLIIFVVRQEDQDADETMRWLFKLLKDGRPLFLLLNYDNSNPELLAKIREKLAQTLSDAADQYGYDHELLTRLQTVEVNVHSAQRGQLENKPALREASGYNGFISRFNNWLRFYEGYGQRISLFHERVGRELIDPVRERMEMADNENPEIQKIAQQIAHLRREYSILVNSSSNQIRHKINLRRPELGALLEQPSDPQAIVASVTQVGEEIAGVMQSWLDNEVQQSLGKSLKFSLNLNNIDVSVNSEGAGIWGNILEKASNTAIETGKQAATPEGIKRLLMLGRKLKIPGLKGRWEKTLGKWAGKAALPVTVALSAAQVGMAHREQQKENAAALNAALQRNQWVDGVCAQLQEGLLAPVEDVLSATFDELIAPFEKERSVLETKADGLERDRLAWDSLADKLDVAGRTCITSVE